MSTVLPDWCVLATYVTYKTVETYALPGLTVLATADNCHFRYSLINMNELQPTTM